MTRRLLPALLLLPVLALVWLNLRWLQADRLAAAVEAQVQRWNDNPGTPLALADWELARERITQALRYHPRRAEYWFLSGQLHQWREQVSLLPPGAELNTLDELLELQASYSTLLDLSERSQAAALDDFRQATLVRPAWTYGWMSYAGYKAGAFEFDEEFAMALHQGQLHGQHVPEIQLYALQLALDYDFIMLDDPSLHQLVVENLRRVLAPESRAAPRALAMLQGAEALAVVCPLLQLDAVIDSARAACSAQ